LQTAAAVKITPYKGRPLKASIIEIKLDIREKDIKVDVRVL
jgi:hypothetical protein